MTTQSPSRMNPRINPWIVVWLCFATLSIVMSARQSVSIMTDVWVRDLGWSKTFIGSGQSVAFIVMGIFSPVAGNLADRFGARAMLTAGLLVVSASFLAFATVPIAGLYIMGYGVLGGIGFATANAHLVSTALAKLFKENGGLANGIANSGSTVGQFITVPLLTLSLGLFFMALVHACRVHHLLWYGGRHLVDAETHRRRSSGPRQIWHVARFWNFACSTQ